VKPLRVYLDTSVFGGYYDKEFAKMTRPFFEMIFSGRITPLLSDTLVAEIADAPPKVRALLDQVLSLGERLAPTPGVIRLQEAYIQHSAIPGKYMDDALHVALATVARAEVLASWNFRHMLRPEQTRRFNAVNLVEGYGLLVIESPYTVTKSLEADDGKG
jgi:hypothetical protein